MEKKIETTMLWACLTGNILGSYWDNGKGKSKLLYYKLVLPVVSREHEHILYWGFIGSIEGNMLYKGYIESSFR